MKVLILGPNGQLGSDLFRQGGLEVPHLQLIPLSRKELDVTQTQNIGPTLYEIDFDVLINCTSYHKTDEVELNATQAFAINAHAVKEMVKASKTKKARFIHISTDYVFGGDSNRPYVETDTPDPINVYGASKAMGENLARMAYPNGTYILRVASLYGVAGASGKGGNFVETMIKVGREKGCLRVVNDITMSPTATADVTSMILKLVQHDVEPGIYHAVNSGQATWYEFAREIIERAAINAEVMPISSDEYQTTAKRPPFSALDNSRMTSIFGPIPFWEDALERYLFAKGHLVSESKAVV